MDTNTLNHVSHLLSLIEQCTRQYPHAVAAQMDRAAMALRVTADIIATDLGEVLGSQTKGTDS